MNSHWTCLRAPSYRVRLMSAGSELSSVAWLETDPRLARIRGWRCTDPRSCGCQGRSVVEPGRYPHGAGARSPWARPQVHLLGQTPSSGSSSLSWQPWSRLVRSGQRGARSRHRGTERVRVGWWWWWGGVGRGGAAATVLCCTSLGSTRGVGWSCCRTGCRPGPGRWSSCSGRHAPRARQRVSGPGSPGASRGRFARQRVVRWRFPSLGCFTR